MLTNVQKETLQALINLYHSSNGKCIKGEHIAEAINRNSGTIRNQMISLRSLGLVKSFPGPTGGYEPTLEAYHILNIPVSDNDCKVPIYKDGKRINDMSVASIEFNAVNQFNGCEVAVKVLGHIDYLNLGDDISIGPTPVNNLCVEGTIVGRDDMDNVLLLDAKTIRSIPKKTVGDIATRDVISFYAECSIKEASKKLANNRIDGGPVLKDGEIIGLFTLKNLVNAISEDKLDSTVGELMSTEVVIVNEDLKIANAIDIMIRTPIPILIIADKHSLRGIVTRTDLMDTITSLKQFPINNK